MAAFLVIRSGRYVWTRAEVWSLDGNPYLIRGGLLEAKRELQQAEAVRREEYPELESAKIDEVFA